MPPTPIAVFEDNIADAEQLVTLAEALANTRKRRMRRELRESVGRALDFRKAERDSLDCVESDDLFVVIKPGGRFARGDFVEDELGPLLRQAVVAVSAAVETYVADRACACIPAALRDKPARLREVSVNLVEVLDIDADYTRRAWGYRKLLERYLRDKASPAPAQVGIVLSTVGRKVDWKMIDGARKLAKGRSEADLIALYERRNAIAHAADRSGRGRRSIDVAQVRRFIEDARAIVLALDTQLAAA